MKPKCEKCGKALTYIFEYFGIHKPFMVYGCKPRKTIVGST